MPEFADLPATQYLRGSRHERASVGSWKKPNIVGAPVFKSYPDAPSIALPTVWSPTEERIQPFLQQRRSIRKFSDQPLPFAALAFMLWAAQGVTGRAGEYLFRAAPSAGALYPVETYCAIERVAGVPPGLYHFSVRNFQLERVRYGAFGEHIALACLGQQFMRQAAVNFIWTAVLRRNFQKYGNRGLRYIFLDAGHICQNLLLAAGAVRGGGCPVAAFFDDEINEIVGIDGCEESALYLASVGLKP
ncbi:MAG: SagB/ThcOx family dehydrogenase [Desulfobulbaceae bacterium]|jgi:SagB-type dehydrogenase family enzyme|nr:SagB/ThcOx family dehydrogenase [Desulfobulbaceae bacterium]